MSESVTSSEFLLGLEEYLKYLKEDKAADEIHSFAKSLQTEDKVIQLVKSYLQHMIPNLPPDLIDLADLCHGFNKSTNNSEEIYKTLLAYCTKTLKKIPDNSDLSNLGDLCHGFNKSTNNSEEIYKTLLAYCTKTLKKIPDNSDLSNLGDLCHNIKTAENQLEINRALLLHITNVLKIKGLEQFAIETGKILRSMDQDNFEEFIVRLLLSKLDKKYPNDKIFRGIMSYLKLNLNDNALKDAFSRSQVKSKIWLVEELLKIDSNYTNVVVMAGWFGQLKNIYDKKLTYAKMRIVEIDKSACETSDYIFNLSNLENYKVKAVNTDINYLTLHKNGYEWSVENFKDSTSYVEKFLPDLIINTSAEHMTEEWYNQIRFKELENNPIVAIQSNNLFNIPEHINCVYSIDHMKKKFPMKEILFEGELQLKGYKRVMLIGRP